MPYPYTEASGRRVARQTGGALGRRQDGRARHHDRRRVDRRHRRRRARPDDEWELGYWLGEPYWNRGYASEAATALRDYAFEALKLERIVAGHYADNHASGRMLTKLGLSLHERGAALLPGARART